jgi:diguanylate cyclase (GGDEF)-like protein
MWEDMNRRDTPRIRRIPVLFAGLALVITLATMSVGIIFAREESKSEIVTNLKARGVTSAGFVSTFIDQETPRQVRRVLPVLVAHIISYKQHHVMLVDASGKLIAASPSTTSASLSAADPALARAVAGASHGALEIAGSPSTFVVTPVGGTTWRLVIAVPNSKLFASISGWPQWLPWIVFLLVAILALIVLNLFIRSHVERVRLATLSKELAQAARTDTVTALPNRRSLQERLTQASAFANRYDHVLSALVIDLDHFKQVNDSHGHEIGDEVLRAVADCMRAVFRESDIFGRWGGDEFLAVLPATDSDGARGAGQRLCERVASIDFSQYGLSEQITLSVGCASASGAAPNDLVNMADDSLFRAKRAGRSQVIVS